VGITSPPKALFQVPWGILRGGPAGDGASREGGGGEGAEEGKAKV